VKGYYFKVKNKSVRIYMASNKLMDLMIALVYTITILSIVIIAVIKNYTEIVIPSVIAIFAATTSLVMIIKRSEGVK
jgi:hypothetical protein